MKLSDRQRRFCDLVLEGVPAGRAYERAGYKPRGDAADQSASRLINHSAAVVAYLEARRADMAKRSAMSADELVAELVRRAFYDPAEIVVHELKTAADIMKLPPEVRRLIRGWRFDRKGGLTLDLVDRDKALAELGKVFGVYQRDRANEYEEPARMMESAFWRYVSALILERGMSAHEAIHVAEANPGDVQAWGREVEGVLKAEDGA